MYILTHSTHNKSMEKSKILVKQKPKKNNAMQKIGKSIKDTFIEMSSSLAGWIDDTSNQFSGSGKKPEKKNASTTQAKFVSHSPKKNA